jgi:hypothetical protein
MAEFATPQPGGTPDRADPARFENARLQIPKRSVECPRAAFAEVRVLQGADGLELYGTAGARLSNGDKLPIGTDSLEVTERILDAPSSNGRRKG